jgi:hypothetical protein
MDLGLFCQKHERICEAAVIEVGAKWAAFSLTIDVQACNDAIIRAANFGSGQTTKRMPENANTSGVDSNSESIVWV